MGVSAETKVDKNGKKVKSKSKMMKSLLSLSSKAEDPESITSTDVLSEEKEHKETQETNKDDSPDSKEESDKTAAKAEADQLEKENQMLTESAISDQRTTVTPSSPKLKAKGKQSSTSGDASKSSGKQVRPNESKNTIAFPKNTRVEPLPSPSELVRIVHNGSGDGEKESKLNVSKFMDCLVSMKKVIHEIKLEHFPDEIEKEVAEIKRKDTQRKTNQADEQTILPNEYDAARNDTRALYNLLIADPQLAFRSDFLWGYTLLHWAARANNLRSVRLLLEAGADARAQSHGGLTPLHTAALGEKTDQIVQLLMEKGAEVDMKTNSGLKARDVARGEKRFLLQSRLDCWDFKVVKQVIPSLSFYM